MTLATARGATDLYPSCGLNIEHARTAFRKICETEYQQNLAVGLVHKHHIHCKRSI